MRSARRDVMAAIGAACLVAVAATCTTATDVDVLEITGDGLLVGQLFLDLDGDGSFTLADSPIASGVVTLRRAGSSTVIQSAPTDTIGAFLMGGVEAGSYVLSADTTVLGDSLSAIGGGTPISLSSSDTLAMIEVGATFLSYSLEDALTAPLGQRIFTSGIALNSRVNFGDGQVHFRGSTLFLRGLNVERGGLAPGDSTRLLGRVVVDNGRPALEDVSFAVLVPSAELVVPTDLSTGVAATAQDTALDAALVRIRTAEITDTSTTIDGHFRFWADDGSDSVEVVVRDFLLPTFNTSLFRPDTVVRIAEATGLLSPHDAGAGVIRWRLLPRAVTDVALETKTADIALTTAFDTTGASMGDTVEIQVVASNLGPHTATSVSVSDTIPTGLSVVSSTTTAGSYSSGSGLWDLGTMTSGSADTLTIVAEVTVAGPATLTNIAEFLGLILEVDPNGGNDAVSVSIPVS